MTKYLGLGALVWLAAACSSSNSNGTVDGGATPLPDGGATNPDAAATCGKLPPSGAQTILAPSANGDDVGADVAFTLDKAGRPFFAYIVENNGAKKHELDVLSWDDCAGTWRAPLKVDDNVHPETTRTLSLSVDPTDGRIGIAYGKTVHLVTPPRVNDTVAAYVAISSDNGLSFKTAKVSDHAAEHSDTEGDINDVDHVRVALGGGKTYVAYNQTYEACPPSGLDCANGTVLATANATGFAYEMVKDGNTKYGGSAVTRGFGLGLALDSDNAPAVAAHLTPTAGYNTTLVFWRPGGLVVKVTDSNNVQNDDGDVSLAFDGKKPRLVYRLDRGPIGAVSEYELSISISDDGNTWTAQLPLPHPESISPSQNLVVHGGKTFVFAGGPHVFTSTDNTTFDVTDLGLKQSSASVSGAVDTSGKYWVGLEGVTPPTDSTGGIVLYRQP